MSIWQPRINAQARVKYVGIVEALESDIKNRQVKPGDRLPTQRQIANVLGVDLTTVTRAMKEAASKGLVEAQIGNGTFIAQTAYNQYNVLHLTEGKHLDLSMNNPPNPVNLKLELEIAEALTQLSETGEQPLNHLSYQETAGHPDDREAGRVWLFDKLGQEKADAILVTSGAHNAIYSILSYLKRSGIKSIAAPELCYPGLRAIADQLQLEVYSVAMDGEGVIPEALEKVIKYYRVGAFYVTPNFDNPTSTTLPSERRIKIADIAQKYQIQLIEDDPYYVFLDTPLPALYTLVPPQTWHIATVSKCLSPALRVAFVVTPNVTEALALAEETRVNNIMSPPLMSAVVARWIQTGRILPLIEAIKSENSQRQALASSIFNLTTKNASAAPHMWLPLPRGMTALNFSEQAGRLGVSVVPSTAFVSTRSQRQGVRISLGGARDYTSLEQGLQLLSNLYLNRENRSKSII
ncbi:Transcriptional regulator, GntR family domain / Aspartate aminotransferase [Methylophaga frappieri]|uniref:Transcriptional regulator, GntR family domain / Aspartate aminotransferase n=1 Tax=Methylophaga frappieri (strain ATCC BAA-2434 / DSM 25690 / JAM7) TaxID=754477 RepID=I1YLL9_METFJ|nr:PLP-dependent aminotransferase family protein [Methylophaga frappieri]AFJ03812.1 Transcriptional regulator, GntR family domain / Aspartate aminotransferase [Methylophaga frappieri]